MGCTLLTPLPVLHLLVTRSPLPGLLRNPLRALPREHACLTWRLRRGGGRLLLLVVVVVVVVVLVQAPRPLFPPPPPPPPPPPADGYHGGLPLAFPVA